jgi:hypothetical protein
VLEQLVSAMWAILRFAAVAGGIGIFTFVVALVFVPQDYAFLIAWSTAMAAWFVVEKLVERNQRATAPGSPVTTLDRVPGADTFVTELGERMRRTKNAGALAVAAGWIVAALLLFPLSWRLTRRMPWLAAVSLVLVSISSALPRGSLGFWRLAAAGRARSLAQRRRVRRNARLPRRSLTVSCCSGRCSSWVR